MTSFPLPTIIEDEDAFRATLARGIDRSMALLREAPAEIARLRIFEPATPIVLAFDRSARSVRRSMLMLRRLDAAGPPDHAVAQAIRHRALLREIVDIADRLAEATTAQGLPRHPVDLPIPPIAFAVVAPALDRIAVVVRRCILLYRHLGRAPRPLPQPRPAPEPAREPAPEHLDGPETHDTPDRPDTPERLDTVPAPLLAKLAARLLPAAPVPQAPYDPVAQDHETFEAKG